MDDIVKIPVEEVKVKTLPSAVTSKIGEEEFVKDFVKLMRVGPDWRTSKTLAEKMGVDVVDLGNWMDKVPELARRPGKEEGTFYYALASRLDKPKEEKRPPGMERRQITPSDRYLLACAHQTYSNLHNLLEKYGMRIWEVDEEAFKSLLKARDRMSAGIHLVAHKMQADLSDLPNF